MDWTKWRELYKTFYPELDMDMWFYLMNNEGLGSGEESSPFSEQASKLMEQAVLTAYKAIESLSTKELERKLMEEYRESKDLNKFADYYMELSWEEDNDDIFHQYKQISDNYRGRWMASLTLQWAMLHELEKRQGEENE